MRKMAAFGQLPFEALIGLFTQNGIPIQFGNITKKMIEKCQELIVVGTDESRNDFTSIHKNWKWNT